MPVEPVTHMDCTLLFRRGTHLVHIEPHLITLGFANLALAEEQQVDHDIRAGIKPEATLGRRF